MARSNPGKTRIEVMFKENSSRNLLPTLYPDPFEGIPDRYSLFLEPISGIPPSVVHPLFLTGPNIWSSNISSVNQRVPQPPEPLPSVPQTIWRLLAGMPWISSWEYPSNKTLVSTIFLQLGQNLLPPFLVSIFMSSYLFVPLVGGGRRISLDWNAWEYAGCYPANLMDDWSKECSLSAWQRWDLRKEEGWECCSELKRTSCPDQISEG